MNINNVTYSDDLFDELLPKAERLVEVGWIIKDKAKKIDEKRKQILKLMYDLDCEQKEFLFDVSLDWTPEEMKDAGF